MAETTKLKKMSLMIRVLAFSKTSKEDRAELKAMGEDMFLELMMAKPNNPYSVSSWSKFYKKL